MRTIICMICLMIASLTACSQTLQPKPRWMSLLVGSDTLVMGPRSEFVLMASKRIVVDNMQTNAIFQISRLNKIVSSQDAEIDFLHRAMNAQADEVRLMAGERNGLREDLNDCRIHAAKDKGWATTGKVAVGIVSVGVLGVITVAVMDATQK